MQHNIDALCWEMEAVAKNNFGRYKSKTEAEQKVRLAINQMVQEFRENCEDNIDNVVNEMLNITS